MTLLQPLPPQIPDGVILMHLIDRLVPVLAIVIIVIGALLAVRMRRGSSRIGPASINPATLQPVEDRLYRLEQSVEAIGLQVERIAEGQRFVTKILSDDSRSQGRLPSGHE